MNKTFYPNSYIHMTCCFLPHNIFPISDSFIIILPAFPIMLHFAVHPTLSRWFCLFFAHHLFFIHFAQVEDSAKNFTDLTAKRSLRIITYQLYTHHNCPSVFMEPCHPVLGWETGKGIISSTSLYSPLSMSRGELTPATKVEQTPEFNSNHHQTSNTAKKSVGKETPKYWS